MYRGRRCLFRRAIFCRGGVCRILGGRCGVGLLVGGRLIR
jgi:hypothetical protein